MLRQIILWRLSIRLIWLTLFMTCSVTFALDSPVSHMKLITKKSARLSFFKNCLTSIQNFNFIGLAPSLFEPSCKWKWKIKGRWSNYVGVNPVCTIFASFHLITFTFHQWKKNQHFSKLFSIVPLYCWSERRNLTAKNEVYQCAKNNEFILFQRTPDE